MPVDELLRLFQTGLSIREVSKRTGVCFATVRNRLLRKGAYAVTHKRVQDGKAICKKCERERPAGEFPALHSGKYLCRECLSEANHASTIRKFGCSPEQYHQLLAHQAGKCAICGASEGHRSRYRKPCKLSVDHDHKKGIIRGLLCNNCNRGLGRFKDSVTILEAAVHYLKREQWGSEKADHTLNC
jgi:hypothetical protein